MSVKFHCDINAVAERLMVSADLLKRRVALTVWGELIATTPVDTGRARAGWNMSAESPGAEKPEHVDAPSGWKRGQTPYYPGPSIPTAPANAQTICIYNNVEYIRPLNYGTSTQAARLFVESAVEKALRGLHA